MSRRFILVDGSSLVHRAFYALPLLTTASGRYTNAAYGFSTMLVKLLNEYKPDRIAVAFDKSRKTFRTEVYPNYKAHRKPTPPELAEQFPLTQELVRAFGIQTLEMDGFEADDIIGTLACRAAENGCEVTIVTGDRDALQLISPSITVLLTRKGISDLEVYNQQTIAEKYGLEPKQLIEVKGLMGDTSDNIPGVPGVGEKTAVKLISEFGSVEAVLNHLDKVSGKKLQQNLTEHRDLAVLSKQLAAIDCQIPLVFEEECYIISPDIVKLKEMLTQFEFKSLLNKVDGLFASEEIIPVASLEVWNSECYTVLKGEALDEWITRVRVAGYMAVSAVVDQTDEKEISGLAIAVNGEAGYIPVCSLAGCRIEAILADKSIAKAVYNSKGLYTLCGHNGVTLEGVIFDPLLAAYLLEPTISEYPITMLSDKYLKKTVAWQEKDCLCDPAYAAWAAHTTEELSHSMTELLVKNGLDKLYNDIELPLAEVLASMEATGIKVDTERLANMSADIAGKVEALLGDIYQAAGEVFNVNSTKQLGVILFEKLKLPVIKKTKTGYSTDAEVLEKLIGMHPLIDKLLEYRLLTKLKSTYLDGMIHLISPETGRLHTTFNQTVTATGRLSSSEPNLQNIPIRTDIGRRIRELFVPDEGYDYLMSADYSQIELRVLAHMAGDEALLNAFRHNKDIHTSTASEVFGVTEDQVTSEMRSRAKAVNFGIVYGISDYGLSRDIGVSRKEAGIYIESYFSRYPGVKAYIERMISDARRDGYVTTLFGRRRYLPEIHSPNFNQRSFAERMAMNTPIQGTAADIIKKAMLDVYQRLTEAGLKSRILLQVHDELVLEVTEEEKEEVAVMIKSAMEEAVTLSVPMTTEVKTGVNWARAK